ncbi:hypothetical protein AK812_SmicGene42585 [Symbiodinium microadriaticum]|uniref:Uncharacterized protein n=1 Tax=Symbiodinium microadriaticum TaxID=2951 RepID=A0A1Q9C367_SYMMI|nr:hypothetical protein AK812_SmicGene42585 [Symbiodinium microadriaticum]
MGHKGGFDFKQIETLMLQQNYADLPEVVRMKGNNQTPYNLQLFILPQGSDVYHIVKYIKFTENTKVNHQTILNMCSGRACEVDLQKHFREGSRGLQYMLEGLGGFQVCYFKLIPAGSSNKVPRETDDIRKGFEYMRKFGPQENANGEFTSWTEEEVNNPNSPLHKRDRGTIKEFLRCLADQGSQANTIKDWPLTFKSLTPWALNHIVATILPHILENAIIWIGKSRVGKSPVSYTLSAITSAFWLQQEDRGHEVPSFQTTSQLDYFRKEKGRRTKPRVFDDGNLNLESPASVKAITEVTGIDRKTMARWNAASYTKNQVCQACSNPYDRAAEPPMPNNANSDTVFFETFFKIVRPSFHKDFDEEDLMCIFKRAVFVVVTGIGIYLRLGNLSAFPPQHAEDLQWSLNLLQAALDGEDVPLCYTIKGRELSTGRKYSKEVRPDLAGISGTTIYYFEETSASSKQPPAKRLKSVKSSNSPLHIPDENSIEKDTEDVKHEDDTKLEVHVKQEMAEATLTVNAFKQSLKGRVLSIKLSDSSAAPEPNIPKPSGESPQDELEEELEALMDEDDI